MGTNYYWHKDAPCQCCGRAYNALHIGKSSAGWCFHLHVIPEDSLTSLDDWREQFNKPGSQILNEYGRQLPAKEMLDIIQNRSCDKEAKPYGYTSWDEFHRANGSVMGPNGCLRSKIDGEYCVGHGEGTWDYIEGEFS